MKWNKVSEKEIPFGEEVIAFNKEWIDEDFNPNGTRIGFLLDDGFISATWNNMDALHGVLNLKKINKSPSSVKGRGG